jgi:hypothetical protein
MGFKTHTPLEYLQRKLSDLSASKGQITSFSGINMKAVELLPAAKDTATSVLGEKVAEQLESIPLSNGTVIRRISDFVSNVKEQVTEKVEASKYYYIQLDEMYWC